MTMKPVPVTILRTCALERAGSNGAGAGSGLLPLPRMFADPGGVARLDRVHREGGRKRLLVGDHRRRAGVGGDARVLERHGGLEERGLRARRALEVELRGLDGLRAERALEELDVRVLVVRDGLGELDGLAGELAALDGLGVEGGLEVLEREREVEDVDVARRGTRRSGQRAGGQCTQQRGSADQGAAAEQGGAKGAGTRHAGTLGRLLQRAVEVDVAHGKSIVVRHGGSFQNRKRLAGRLLRCGCGETRRHSFATCRPAVRPIPSAFRESPGRGAPENPPRAGRLRPARAAPGAAGCAAQSSLPPCP